MVFSPTGVELFCGMVKLTMSCVALATFFSFLPFLLSGVRLRPVTLSFSASVMRSLSTSLRREVSATCELRRSFCDFISWFSERRASFSLFRRSISST